MELLQQLYSFTIRFRVANVRHNVILTIRNTYILSQQCSTRVKNIIRVSRIHYIAENVTAQLLHIDF